MEFEWDPEKSDRTFEERGFDFAFAVGIFDGPTEEAEDIRTNYGEVRVLAIGETEGVILAVVFTDRGSVRRIISARRANRRERARWRSKFG